MTLLQSRAPLAHDLYVVLTSRGIELSKARLADALTPAERAELNRWLLGRTLSVIAQWLGSMDRCLVVTACAEVFGTAQHAGARVLERPARGHNDAAQAGAAQVALFGARKIVFLPADLPDLRAPRRRGAQVLGQCRVLGLICAKRALILRSERQPRAHVLGRLERKLLFLESLPSALAGLR